MDPIGAPQTLTEVFPSATNRGRKIYATILTAIREGTIEDSTNALAELRRRLNGYRVDVPVGQTLTNRLKHLEDEGLIARTINGRRTVRIATTDLGQTLDLGYLIPKSQDPDLDPRVTTAQLERTGDTTALAALQDHFADTHPASWDNLTPSERDNLPFLERIDVSLPHATDEKGPSEQKTAPRAHVVDVPDAALLTINVFRTDNGTRIVLDVPDVAAV